VQHVRASTCTVALDDVGQLTLDRAQPKCGQTGPQHLAIERVGESHREPPLARDGDDQSVALERLERARAVDAVEIGKTEPLADSEQLEHGETFRVDTRHVLCDELVEGGARRKGPRELPAATRLHERASVTRCPDQFGQHLQVSPGQPGELRAGPLGHRSVERPVEQRPELVRFERTDLHPHEVTVAVQHRQLR
jgi:hypothetical protein